jgi:hypothetical protein
VGGDSRNNDSSFKNVNGVRNIMADSNKKYLDVYLETLKSKVVIGTDSNGKIIDGLTGADARYLLLNQTTPQTTVGTFTFPQIKDSGLTQNQVVYAGANGLLTTNVGFTYNPSYQTMTAGGATVGTGAIYAYSFGYGMTIDTNVTYGITMGNANRLKAGVSLIALGANNTVGGTNTPGNLVAIGSYCSVQGSGIYGSTAIGDTITLSNIYQLALGQYITATEENAVLIGTSLTSDSLNSTILGTSNTVSNSPNALGVGNNLIFYNSSYGTLFGSSLITTADGNYTFGSSINNHLANSMQFGFNKAGLTILDGVMGVNSPQPTYPFEVGGSLNKIGKLVTTKNTGDTDGYLVAGDVTARIYSYKTIRGVKTYLATYVESSTITIDDSNQSINYSWIGTTDVDGYVVLIKDTGSGYDYDYFYDVSNATGYYYSDPASLTTPSPTSSAFNPYLWVDSSGMTHIEGGVNTVAEITNGVAVQHDDADSSLVATGNYYLFTIFAYKDFGDGNVYSPVGTLVDMYDDSSSNPMHIDLAWDAPTLFDGSAPDGYLIRVDYDDQNYYYGDAYWTVATNSATYDGTATTGLVNSAPDVSLNYTVVGVKSLKVHTGDVEVVDKDRGVIIHSPDDTAWRITVSDLGVVSAEAA